MARAVTIFLCATHRDLSQERAAVLDSIRRLQLQHDSMEYFGARPHRPIETCLQEVRKSDVLVVIVSHLYGSLVPATHVSFTETEYAEGQRLGKPCLVYLRSDDVPILPEHMEQNPDKRISLDRFKKALMDRHTVARYRQAVDLSLQVAVDLSRLLQESVGPAGEAEVVRVIEESRDGRHRLKRSVRSKYAGWYLKISDGNVFGPCSTGELRRWAEEGRVAPGNLISEDCKIWMPSQNLLELEMDWEVELVGGEYYGPINLRSVGDLLRDGTLFLQTRIRNVRTGNMSTIGAQEAGIRAK